MKEKMTREEAIDWLCRLKSNLVVYMPKEWHENIISALSVAIQALEQQPCEDIPTITIPVEDYIKLTEQEPTTKNDLGVDCISREQALVAIRNLYPSMPRVDFNGSLRKWVDKYKPYIECDDAIEQIPSVTPIRPKGHWINTDATHSKCDRCGAIFEIASANGETNYCPNCGSDNREVEE